MRSNLLVDSHGRILRDLRVSITDRCNFRCMYCLPETEAAANFYRGRWAQGGFHPEPIARQWVPRSHLLSFEEIERVVRIAVSLGIEKVRLTGGEPLLRQELEKLVSKLSEIDGVRDLALTTNGLHFKKKGGLLQRAGLRRISFSLDSLERENFRKITGRDALNEVLEGIQLAQELGLQPVKVNAVIIREVNDHEVQSLAQFAVHQGVTMRFIEFMPLDSGRAWMKELVVPAKEILHKLRATFVLDPVVSENRSETAKRWTIRGTRTEIGIIAPVSEPFCGHCNRVRLTADGKIRTCLFSVAEHDLRSLIRGRASDEEIADYLQRVVWDKEPGHRIGQPDFVPASRSMSCIGG
jgi:cyclic pyranopterin phosphate synthase